MRSKAKWLLLVGLVALIFTTILGCQLLQPRTSFTKSQVIVLIVNYGVPYIGQYYRERVGEEEYKASGGIESATPSGEWDASYEGNSIWSISGTITTGRWGNCSTMWTFREDSGEMRLAGIDCQ